MDLRRQGSMVLFFGVILALVSALVTVANAQTKKADQEEQESNFTPEYKAQRQIAQAESKKMAEDTSRGEKNLDRTMKFADRIDRFGR